MANIVQVGSSPVVDYMARDYDSLLQAMYNLIPSKLPEWTDFNNQADFGNVLLEMFAYMGDILSYYQDRVANESLLGTAQTRRSIIEHLRLIGYTLSTAVPASTGLFVTVPAAVNDVVTVQRGDAFATKSQKNKPSLRFEYTQQAPLTIDFSTIPVVSGKKTYTGPVIAGKQTSSGVPVEEGRLIQSEVLGTSDGSADQRFVLAHSPLILRPIATAQQSSGDVTLLTQLGVNIVSWNLQDTLAFSRADQNDYIIEVDENDEATVVFGDGVFGVIPPSGAQVQVTYRVGGGSAGNTPANTIQTIVGAPQLALLAAQVTNPGASTGGDDRETIQHAVQNAPSVFRSLKRAVTQADYEALALSFKGVGKVQARATGWNTVTLYVAPEGSGKVSDTLEAGLKAFFEDKRMLSQIIEVADVDYVSIYVTAQIGVQSYYVTADVQAAVQQAAAALLAFDNVSFGQTIYLSKFYEASETIPGVQFVNITEFRRGDEPSGTIESTGFIKLASNEVATIPPDAAYATGIQVVLVQGGS
jgi:hypothetical protein